MSSNALVSARGSRIDGVWCHLTGGGRHEVVVLFASGSKLCIEHDSIDDAVRDYESFVTAQKSGEVVEGGER